LGILDFENYLQIWEFCKSGILKFGFWILENEFGIYRIWEFWILKIILEFGNLDFGIWENKFWILNRTYI